MNLNPEEIQSLHSKLDYENLDNTQTPPKDENNQIQLSYSESDNESESWDYFPQNSPILNLKSNSLASRIKPNFQINTKFVINKE